jgi:hypothetical protein
MADADEQDFIRLPRDKGGPDYSLRTERAGMALSVHIRALIVTAANGAPGFVPDALLHNWTPEPTAAIVELCRAGMWERADGGYLVRDEGRVEWSIKRAAEAPARRADCEKGGGHMPDYGRGVLMDDGPHATCLVCDKVLMADLLPHVKMRA